MLASLIAKLKDQLESGPNIAPVIEPQASFDFGPSLMHRDQRQQLNEGTPSADTFVPWDEIGVVTEEQQAKTDQTLREMRAIAKRHQEKATKKAAKKVTKVFSSHKHKKHH